MGMSRTGVAATEENAVRGSFLPESPKIGFNFVLDSSDG